MYRIVQVIYYMGNLILCCHVEKPSSLIERLVTKNYWQKDVGLANASIFNVGLSLGLVLQKNLRYPNVINDQRNGSETILYAIICYFNCSYLFWYKGDHFSSNFFAVKWSV